MLKDWLRNHYMPSLSWAASLLHLPNLHACPPTRDEFGRSVDLAENFRETASGTFQLIGGVNIYGCESRHQPTRTGPSCGGVGCGVGSWAASLRAAQRVGSAPQPWPRARAYARGGERKSAKLQNEWRKDLKTQLAARRSECDERHHLIQMLRHFPQCGIWPIVRVARFPSTCLRTAQLPVVYHESWNALDNRA